jgi:hypothetical protein
VSKDKSGKKDKWKHHDLFDMMLNQSQVFRDMVEHFQKAWVPKAPTMVIEAAVGTRHPERSHAKAAPAAKAAKKASPRKAAPKAKAKAKPASTSRSTLKPSGGAKATSARKAAGKTTARRPARKP